MRATPLLIGCLLGLGAIANAAASGASAAGSTSASSYNCPNQPADHTASHESASSGGDVLNIPRSGSSTHSSSSARATSPTNTDENSTRFGASDTTPSSGAHSSGLGWQSLLPGSIQ